MGDTYIIAIDFGTTYSGYAYSLSPSTTETAPHLRRWGQELGLDTAKTPTCVLFDSNGNFMHFGYKAKNKYLETDKGDATEYFFFENFKMELYNKSVTGDLTIKDINKRPMSALKVFSAALRFLKDDALKTIFINTNGMRFTASDFTWVLTVPAIWDFSARQFMREAAAQAGIVSSSSQDKLVIALEPEAASVLCKKLPATGFISEDHSRASLEQTAGTCYMVVDCGGGTIDITVHEVLEGGTLKELHKASGNDKGGRRVDRKFVQCMREFFCDGLWEEYERDFRSEAQKFMYDFEIVKLATGDAKMKCYCNLGRLVDQKQNEGEEVFNRVQGVSWDRDKILISKNKMESFFHESLIHITDTLSEVLNRHPAVKHILLVGGFAQSSILCDHVRKEFGDQAKVLCPKNPQEVILKGAVMFGRDRSVIRTRKSAFTYGVAMYRRFDTSKHKEEYKTTNKEGEWCRDLFSQLVAVGEDVGWDETKKYTFGPIESHQKKMKLSFYKSERTKITYVDEWGVGPIGSCVVDMPDVSKGRNRTVTLEVFFGFTEMKAKATDLESKQTASVKMEFNYKQQT